MAQQYPAEVRTKARYNWATSNLTDTENAKMLGLFRADGSPNSSIIKKWRDDSMDESHPTYSENWMKYKNEILSLQESERVEAYKSQLSENMNKMLKEADNFRDKSISFHNYMENLVIKEMRPKKAQASDGSVIDVIDPDMNTLKAVKLASECFRVNSSSHFEIISNFFAQNQVDSNESEKTWEQLLMERYSQKPLELSDPSYSGDFYTMDDEEFDKLLEETDRLSEEEYASENDD